MNKSGLPMQIILPWTLVGKVYLKKTVEISAEVTSGYKRIESKIYKLFRQTISERKRLKVEIE